MNIQNSDNNPFNYAENLKPLFDAMKAGKTIKSVTCMAGTSNRENPEKDFTIENFKAVDYWVAISHNHDSTEKHDYVNTDVQKIDDAENLTDFYMNWVRSFQID
jgi:hypothetical protein